MEEELIKKYERLVYKIVNKFSPPEGSTYEDLVQVGRIGLLNAIRNYDTSYGTTFITFAYQCIRAELIKYIRPYLAVKRTGGVVSLDLPVPDTENLCIEDILAASVNVEEEVIANDLLYRLTEKQPEIVKMRLEGYSQPEIARKVGLSQAEISRKLKKLRKKVSV